MSTAPDLVQSQETANRAQALDAEAVQLYRAGCRAEAAGIATQAVALWRELMAALPESGLAQ